MATGSQQVEQSATLGRQAGEALGSILHVVDETHAQASAIATTVGRMTASVDAVQEAAEHVARLAANTALAAEGMQQGAAEARSAVETPPGSSDRRALTPAVRARGGLRGCRRVRRWS